MNSSTALILALVFGSPQPIANQTDLCKCGVSCGCADLAAAKAAKTTVVAKIATTQTVVATRPAIGHTHTCRNGHTWDHAMTPGHNCPICGQSQFVQDQFPRPVTVIQQRKLR